MNQDNSNQPIRKSRNKIGLKKFDGKPDKCVIYARANSDSLSLTVQKEACETYAKENGLAVIEYFGHKIGLEGREDFKKMWEFVTENCSQVKYILVFSLDRFSRAGANAILLINQLRTQYGIVVRAINLPEDSAGWEFAKGIIVTMAKLDNGIRRERILVGLKKRVEEGLWVALPPYGYTATGRKKLVISKEGKWIRKAFRMKAECVPTSKIMRWLNMKGVNFPVSRLKRIFKNIFYAGYISTKLFPGQVIRGKHPAIIDLATFWKINSLTKRIRRS